MTRTKKTVGMGTVASALLRMLHPSAIIQERYPNPRYGERLHDLLVIRREMKTIHGREQMAIIMRHDHFDGEELYCVEKFVRVERDGTPEHFFDPIDTVVAVNPPAEVPADEMLPETVVPFLGRDRVDSLDAQLLAGEIPTDNDNEPAPENVPVEPHLPTPQPQGCWGHNNICFRKAAGGRDTDASFRLPRELPVSLFRLFELCFFKSYVVNVLLPLVNNNILPGETVSYGEFLRWIGLWLIMATVEGATRQEYWSTEPVSLFKGVPFRLGDLMSSDRFEAILYSLRYTNIACPPFNDPFHEVRQMVAAWNSNMAEVFVPSWVSSLDVSMSYWTHIYSCPGFMFVPRKPWPLGNEWHTICCAKSGVMYAIELVEGKDRPLQLGKPEFDDLGGKTVGLLIRLTRPIWETANVVILDSAFCVARALTELAKRDVFASALIEKRRYWPKHVDGDMIEAHFDEAMVGDTDCYRFDLPDDNARLHIHGVKEPDYVLMLMSTYGIVDRVGEQKKRVWKSGNADHTATFQYPEIVHNHCQYRHAVDDHNNRRQSPISLEKTWSTDRWPDRVFAFLIAITEINVLKAWINIFGNPDVGTVEFRKKLAEELIHNPYLMEESAQEARRDRPSAHGMGDHALMALPPYSKFQGTKINVEIKAMADEDDGLWEKPAWAKGGVKLKSTGKADAMKTEGNLAAPITFTPFKNDDHSNKVANAEILRKTEVGEAVKQGQNLAMPITNIRDEIRKAKKGA